MNAETVYLEKLNSFSIEEKKIKDILIDKNCIAKIKNYGWIITNIIKNKKLESEQIKFLKLLTLKNKMQCIGCMHFEECKLITLVTCELNCNNNIMTPNIMTILKKYEWLNDLFYNKELDYYYDNYDILVSIQAFESMTKYYMNIELYTSNQTIQRLSEDVAANIRTVKTTITNSVSLSYTELNYLRDSIVTLFEILSDMLKDYKPNRDKLIEYKVRNIKAAYYRMNLYLRTNKNSSTFVIQGSNDFIKRCNNAILFSEKLIEEIRNDYKLDFATYCLE